MKVCQMDGFTAGIITGLLLFTAYATLVFFMVPVLEWIIYGC